MRKKFLLVSLLIMLLLQNSTGAVIALSDVQPPFREASNEKNTASSSSKLTVQFSTATEKTIVFRSHEQEAEVRSEPVANEIPHLVLRRNGVPTPGFERTLKVSVGSLLVPPSGIYVHLVVESQHGDPDLERKRNVRIRIRKETRYVPYDAFTQQGVNVQFNLTFDPITELPHKTIKTPTDYYRCRVIISDAQGNQLQTYVEDYAFLMENQWRVPLPEVLEAVPGAAPDELLVYYYDMMPFQSNLRDPDTQIPREEVDGYIQTELVPAMVEAFQIQSNTWEFPWYEEWRNFRREEDPKTLSVALGEYSIWFHGKPASLGHSMISIRVDGTAGEYDSLTDGIMSVFHHELFHNHQRNLSLYYGKHAGVAGKDRAWMMFTEGTAVLASSVGQPAVQFAATTQPRSYLRRANAFIGSEGAIGSGLNKSYKDIPYHTALYWRFLYERCGGINDQQEDPASGMKVIRQILETLYKGEIVDIDSSTNVAEAFPRILDAALQSTPSCPFRSYEESLIHFARAIYMLRLEDGRCRDAIDMSNCGLSDPRHLYQTPRAENYLIESNNRLQINGSIPSSFGIDLNEVVFSPAVKGKTVRIVFTGNADPDLAFNVEVWKIKMSDASSGTERQSARIGEPISMSMENNNLVIEVGHLNENDFDGLGLIITRLDSHEDTEATGTYSIRFLTE